MSVTDDYLQKVPAPEKRELERIRRLVKQVVPEAEEVISYGMPAFKLRGKYLIAFAPFKNHLSIFPGAGPIENLQDTLGDFKQSKGTIQFTLDHPIPESILKVIVASCSARIVNK